MIFGLFRRSANETLIDRIYAAVVVSSRQPGLYVELGIPDTFEGRFESLTLHAVLVLRRLKELEAPGPDMAQHLVDTVFKHFDRTLREMGVGDTTVPKRMKSMAEAFLGRSTAYDEAMRAGPDALARALARNVYVGRRDGTDLARYVMASVAALAAQPLQTYMDGTLRFADPTACAADVGRVPSVTNPEVAT